mmetsp:Transcript_23264/g.51065  ORF Transcript_23264/g.51065 Transcript_23264/m.51065 type:complete len:232 (+) Transcript_23264:889-1584(+)
MARDAMPAAKEVHSASSRSTTLRQAPAAALNPLASTSTPDVTRQRAAPATYLGPPPAVPLLLAVAVPSARPPASSPDVTDPLDPLLPPSDAALDNPPEAPPRAAAPLDAAPAAAATAASPAAGACPAAPAAASAAGGAACGCFRGRPRFLFGGGCVSTAAGSVGLVGGWLMVEGPNTSVALSLSKYDLMMSKVEGDSWFSSSLMRNSTPVHCSQLPALARTSSSRANSYSP